ncbi:glycoside hydrolase family 127 protein [Asanoa sp. WMMD1127]|uniref:glycoside hydrolase family 127 protein n=1 Tax=Asanoa sp. WMMD1127 TaxID=3016107 RepID=UPI00241715C3|nr:beta-L-arabinofuranosidase domain-containing protein [Asanoa sp. WMMD1127]MDG4825729.1 glycoside hydrolase family 127 protein [Asanoa sp. WMMD1127]
MSEHRPGPVVDTTASGHARLRPVAPRDVRITDDFWAPRLRRNREVTIPAQHQQCETTGALRNFARAAGSVGGGFSGRYYSDSDVYKWIEAASWTLATDPSPELADRLDAVIKLVAGAQDADGYLNTYFSVDRVGERWTDLVVRHEMYCIGHLVAAAVAHMRATGRTDLLDVAVAACTHIATRFAPGEAPGTCGHPGLEMALVELYRTTGDERWLRLATWQLDSRGRGVLDGSEYLIDHQPVRAQDRVTGHAVRALYLYAGMADVVLETGDASLRAALERLWADLAGGKTAVTGGVGARWDGEAFGDAYELPDRAYNETCASIAHIFLAWRLLLLTGEPQYRDVVETALHNGVLPGLSQSGTEFFYQNPLADAGRHRREPWFDCACCPPNIARLLASLPGYLWTTSEEGLWAQLYIGNEAALRLADGTPVSVALDTSLPWDGAVRVTVSPAAPSEFTLFLPLPGWAGDDVTVVVNGAPVTVSGPWVSLRRTWAPGDVVELTFGTPVRALVAHPRVAATHHRVALARGPLVYCVEQADHDVPVDDLRLTGAEAWTADHRPDLLGGVTTLTADGSAVAPDDGPLYRPLAAAPAPGTAARVTAIPYYAWANREPGAMRVFVPLADR